MWLRNKTYGYCEKDCLLPDRKASREDKRPVRSIRRQKWKLRASRFAKYSRGAFAVKKFWEKHK